MRRVLRCFAGAVLWGLPIGWTADSALYADEPAALPENAIASIAARRCAANPLITLESHEWRGNINGPSVIRAPAWLGGEEGPLAKYYMYAAHHHGKTIRLAYADALEGPWRVYKPGTLTLEDAAASFKGHIASPDVHVDRARREIRMYFHGPAKERRGQWTGVALSQDGLRFEASDEILGRFYFRVFPWRDAYYAISKGNGWGCLYRSDDGLRDFEMREHFIERMRHCAVTRRGDTLLVFYSRLRDAPERIVAATVDLSGDWRDWRASAPIDVIAPDEDYEGARYPVKPSRYGSAKRVRQLRDPCIFEEGGRTYLFYTIAGEMGIAMAELDITMK